MRKIKRTHNQTSIVKAFGLEKKLVNWANMPICTVSASALKERLDLGWPSEVAITAPRHTRPFRKGSRSACWKVKKHLKDAWKIWVSYVVEQGLASPVSQALCPRSSETNQTSVRTVGGGMATLAAGTGVPEVESALLDLGVQLTAGLGKATGLRIIDLRVFEIL